MFFQKYFPSALKQNKERSFSKHPICILHTETKSI